MEMRKAGVMRAVLGAAVAAAVIAAPGCAGCTQGAGDGSASASGAGSGAAQAGASPEVRESSMNHSVSTIALVAEEDVFPAELSFHSPEDGAAWSLVRGVETAEFEIVRDDNLVAFGGIIGIGEMEERAGEFSDGEEGTWFGCAGYHKTTAAATGPDIYLVAVDTERAMLVAVNSTYADEVEAVMKAGPVT